MRKALEGLCFLRRDAVPGACVGFILAPLRWRAQEKLVKPTIAFLDCEASGLSGESWPIEVAYAASDGGADEFLLSRQPEWSLEAWDRYSARTHGISLADLEENGISAKAAIERLSILRNAVVVSDAAEFENFWLGRLAQAAGAELPFTVVDWETVLPADQTREERDDFLTRARADEPRLHRAAPDSRVMRAVWRASGEKAHAAWAE